MYGALKLGAINFWRLGGSSISDVHIEWGLRLKKFAIIAYKNRGLNCVDVHTFHINNFRFLWITSFKKLQNLLLPFAAIACESGYAKSLKRNIDTKAKKRRGFLFSVRKSFVIAANIYRPPQTQQSERNWVCTEQNGKYQLFVKKYAGNKFCEFDGVFGIGTSCDT